jgi:DNA-binding response OmpR family regulator
MKRFSVFIVEDDLVTSVGLAKALHTELPDAHILRAATLREARLILAAFDIQFFIIDVNLPDGNGIDFIVDVTSKSPQAGVVVMTSDALPKHRDRATSYGALFFMEKPLSWRTLGQIIRTHLANTLGAAPTPDTSFTAALTRLTALDVLQLKCLGRATVRLDFSLRDGRFGSVYLQDGQITHAESNRDTTSATLVGISALAEILGWRGGKVVETKGADQPTPSLRGPWQSLLLEAAQLGDEMLSKLPTGDSVTRQRP